MNFLKKKKVIIPIIIIIWLILIAYVTKFAGALTILGTIAGGIYLFTKNEKFKSKSKKVKAIAVVGLVLIFILGVSAVTYDPVLFQQRKIQAEKAKAEKQKQEQIEKQKEAEEKSKKEAEEKAKVTEETATKTTNKAETKTTSTKAKTETTKDVLQENKTLMDAGTFLTLAKITGDRITLEYTYTDSERDIQYFEMGDKINKVLMEAPYRCIKHYPDLKSISLKITGYKYIYSINISKQELENFIGFKLDKIDDTTWHKIDNTVYTKKTRNDFVLKYAKIKNVND